MEQFVTRKLKISLDTNILQKFNNGLRLVLKTPSVTFNFYTKTDLTVQVQGKATEDREMKNTLAEIVRQSTNVNSQSNDNSEYEIQISAHRRHFVMVDGKFHRGPL